MFLFRCFITFIIILVIRGDETGHVSLIIAVLIISCGPGDELRRGFGGAVNGENIDFSVSLLFRCFITFTIVLGTRGETDNSSSLSLSSSVALAKNHDEASVEQSMANTLTSWSP